MGEEKPEDGEDDEDDSLVWESVEGINSSANETAQPADETASDEKSRETAGESPASDDHTEPSDPEAAAEDNAADETETVDIANLIAEDPPDIAPEETDIESAESNPPEPSRSRGDRDNTQTNSNRQAQTSGEERSDRLWNRFGRADDDPDPQSRSPSGTNQSGSTETSETTGDKPTERSATADSTSGNDSADREETKQTTSETDAGQTGSDRLWNRTAPSTDTTPSNDPKSSDKATGKGGDAGTQGGDELSEQRTSFDRLLDRSDSGAGNPRPVGSPSVETNLDAFFSDLEEFDRATSGSQVLVISPRGHSIGDDVCSQFLTAGGVSGRNAMFITAVDPPEERVDICRSNENWTGGKVAVIELGDTGSDSDRALGQIAGEEVVQKRVNSPKNLSKTGLLITQTLKKWASSDQPSILCFHTLTAISGYVENETLFQFLFTLQAKLNSLGVTGHYHMDANKHDQQEINTLKTLFDLVITISRDGDIEVE